ncbi:MAG: hypothetical protein OXM56_00740, partial [Gammaproteobacteria bacterium]|nr:hypothetical protein [Gammaproteobacteria bacterium]
MTRTGKAICWVTGTALALLVAYDSFYIVRETEQGVLTHFGRIAPPVRQPGFRTSRRRKAPVRETPADEP